MPVTVGEQMTVRDLLYGMMLHSGNDAANAVAVLVSGSVEAFVAEMNRRAAALGCDCALLATQADVPAHRFYLKPGFREIPTAYLFKGCLP